MRILLFSDLHGHSFKPYSTTLSNGRNSRLQDTVNVLDEIYQACSDYGVDGVLFGGDLFHARGTLQVGTFNAIFEGIAKIKTCVQFFGLLVGNHDQANRVGSVHACYPFESIVTVMEEPKWYCFHNKEGEKLNVFAIPYTENPHQIDLPTEEEFMEDATSICLAHLGISGAVVGSNYVMVTEDNLTTIPFTKAGFEQTFLGHFHKPQILTPNIRYIGATHQHNWGDAEDSGRGYLIYDTEDGIVESFTTNSAPKFVKISDQSLGRKDLIKGNFVRRVYDLPPEEEDWKKDQELLLSFGARHVEQWVAPLDTVSAVAGDFLPGTDFEDMVESFVGSSNAEGLDKELLISIGKEALRKVS